MKLSFIKIAGFRGIRDEIDLPLPSGFLVISGRNGSGKTTICDAIEFALRGDIRPTLGRTEKGETIEDYIWWRGPQPPPKRSVTLGIANEDGEVIEIKRGPGELATSNEAKIQDLICRNAATEENCVENLCRTTIIRGEEVTRLSLDMSEIERFEFVQSSLGTAGYSDVEARAEEVHKLLKQKLDSASNNYLRTRDIVSSLIATISEARVQAAGSEMLTDAENTIRSMLNTHPGEDIELLELAASEASKLRADSDDLENVVEKLSGIMNRITELKTEQYGHAIGELRSQISDNETQLDRARDSLTTVDDAMAEFQSHHPEVVSLANLLGHGRKYGLTDRKCPLCGLSISKDEFEDHLELVEKKISAESKSIIELTEKRAALLTTIDEVGLSRDQQAERLSRLLNEEEAIDKELGDLRDHPSLTGLEIVDSDNRIITGNIERKIDDNRKKIRVLNEAIGTIEASLLHDRIAELDEELKVARESASDLEKDMQGLQEATGVAKDAYDTVRRVIREDIDEQLAELSPLLEELYFRLKPHIDWRRISYHIRGDVRRFLSLDVGDGVNPSYIFSSGQRRITGLAFLLAVHMSRWWCRLDTLIVDDPVQHIDDFRALNLAETLGAIRRTSRQLVCTVEDPALADLLCRRLGSTTDEPGMLVELEYHPGTGVQISSTRSIKPAKQRILMAA